MKIIIAFLLVALAFAIEIPTSYDTRVAHPECAMPIRNQGQCGSCWAFSATTALSERFCIHSKQQKKPILSPQYLVNCDTAQYGCQGGYMIYAYQFMQRKGVPEDSCIKYYSGETKKEGPCPNKCDDGRSLPLFYGASAYSIRARDVKAMQEDILKNGPITVGFRVYEDFKTFFANATTKTGVYQHKTGKLLGGHGVVIIGWGEENNTPYWIVHNSWAATWGDKGYFKIIRGKDDCQIESMMTCAGLPKVGTLPSYAIPMTRGFKLNAETEVEITESIQKVAQTAFEQVLRVNSAMSRISRIVSAKVQVVAGFNYKFQLAHQDGSVSQMDVYESPLGEIQVTNLL